VRYALLIKVSVAFLVLSTPAFAFGLTDADYDYLTAQNFPRDSAILRGLSPKEQARLHAIITDGTSDKDPTVLAKTVAEAIAVFQGHQLWEQGHPGQLWDYPKR